MSEVDDVLAAMARAREARLQREAQERLAGQKPAAPAPESEGGIKRWIGRLPANIGVGVIDAALEALEFFTSDNPDFSQEPQVVAGTGGLTTAQLPKAAATPQQRRATPMMSDEYGELQPAVDAVKQFRNELADGSRLSDTVTQGIAQFTVPYIGFLRTLRGIKAAEEAPRVVRALTAGTRYAAAESGTMAVAFDPHAPRIADLIELGKHTEGRLAEVLNTIAPDGSALNAYIDYMTDRTNESDAEGRWKNVIDNLGVSLATTALLKTGAKTIKSARDFVTSPVQLPEIGAPEHLAVESQRLADEALMQFRDNPHAAMVHLTEQADNTLDDTERATIQAARDRVAAELPEQGITIVPSPEGYTVVVGKQPLVTFLNEADAQAAVADARRTLGMNFELRAAAEHAQASDSNFATLHAFSRVLQKNVDRPVSTHSLLSALERNLKGDTEQGAFYKELLGRLVRKKVAGVTVVSSKPGRHENSAGFHLRADNGIELYPLAFKDTATLLHTFAHEAVHAATVHEMNASPRVVSQMERLRKQAIEALTPKQPSSGSKEFDEAAAAQDKARVESRNYGFTNAFEFVAEIESNPEFRKLMQKTKLPDGGTAWDKYLETIAGILGITALIATPTGKKEFSKLMMGPKQEEKPRA